MKPGDKATTANTNEEIVKAYNSLCDEYYRLLHGPSDSALWHGYMCATLANPAIGDAYMCARYADEALEKYKKRWREDENI